MPTSNVSRRKATGEARNPRREKVTDILCFHKNAYRTNQSGKAICWKYNNVGCVDDCSRAHQCERCLGHHKATEYDRATKGGKTKSSKGKQKGSDAAGWGR